MSNIITHELINEVSEMLMPTDMYVILTHKIHPFLFIKTSDTIVAIGSNKEHLLQILEKQMRASGMPDSKISQIIGELNTTNLYHRNDGEISIQKLPYNQILL